MKFRKISGGNHSLKLNGKRIVVRPGGILECDPEDLGSHISQYQVLTDDMKVGSTPLELEINRLTHLFKLKSIWLSPNKEEKPNGNLYQKLVPQELAGLQTALAEKVDDGLTSGTPGELVWAKAALRKAWDNWSIECGNDPLRRFKPEQPEGHWMEVVAQHEAHIIIIEAEIEEIQSRINSKLAVYKKVDEDEITKRRYRGQYRTILSKEGEKVINWCDGREVIQNDEGMPIFADNGEDVATYLEKCKRHAPVKSRGKKVGRSRKSSTARA